MATENETGGGSSSDYQDIDAFVTDGEQMLNNTLGDTQTKDLMNGAGYTDAVITVKLDDLAKLRELNEAQATEYGEQKGATAGVKSTKDTYHPTYMDHLALARIALRKDVEARRALGLADTRKRSNSGYVVQAFSSTTMPPSATSPTPPLWPPKA